MVKTSLVLIVLFSFLSCSSNIKKNEEAGSGVSRVVYFPPPEDKCTLLENKSMFLDWFYRYRKDAILTKVQSYSDRVGGNVAQVKDMESTADFIFVSVFKCSEDIAKNFRSKLKNH